VILFDYSVELMITILWFIPT